MHSKDIYQIELMSQLWVLVSSKLPPRYPALHCHKIRRQARGADRVVVAWSGPPQAHHCRSNERETDAASYPSHRGRVVLIVLLTDQWCEAFVEDLGCDAHASGCWKHQWREWAVPCRVSSLDDLWFTHSIFSIRTSRKNLSKIETMQNPYSQKPYAARCSIRGDSDEWHCRKGSERQRVCTTCTSLAC